MIQKLSISKSKPERNDLRCFNPNHFLSFAIAGVEWENSAGGETHLRISDMFGFFRAVKYSQLISQVAREMNVIILTGSLFMYV